MAGTIAEDKLHAFERLLFRATRGNMFLKHSSVGTVVDPTTTEKVEKAVFVVFFAGERARSKVLKVRACSLCLALIQSIPEGRLSCHGLMPLIKPSLVLLLQAPSPIKCGSPLH